MKMYFCGVVPDEIILATGKIAIDAAGMDTLLGMVVGSLKGLHANQIPKEIQPLDTRRKNEMFLELIGDDLGKTICAEIASILADRNLYIHGVGVAVSPDAKEPDAIAVYRGKYSGAPQARTLKELGVLLDRIAEVNGHLLDCINVVGDARRALLKKPL